MKTVLRISLVVCVVLFCGILNVHAQWKDTHFPSDSGSGIPYALAADGTNIFAGTLFDGVFLSTNNGLIWTQVNSGLTELEINALAFNGGNLYASAGHLEQGMFGYYSGNFFLSTNHGSNWTCISGFLWDRSRIICAIAFRGTNIFAGAYGDIEPSRYINGGIYLSKDNGANWVALDSGFSSAKPDIYAFAFNGTKLFAGGSGVYLSTNDGTSWTSAGLTDEFINDLAINGSILFAATQIHGLFRSSNDGISWTAVNSGLAGTNLFSLAVYGKNVFAGTASGVFLTTNNGTNWTPVNEGITDSLIQKLLVSGKYLFAGTANGIWRRPLSEMTGIDEQYHQAFSGFALHQNYPNPFSPSTTISFTIPSRSFVSLKIFDALGKEVSTLVSGDLDVGEHSFQWNASGLRNGVYLCRLQAGSFVATQKLTLLR